MPKQLTIFDVEPRIVEFDKNRANWKELPNTGTHYTDVIVKIPKKAKLPTELPPTTAYDRRYELFEQYCYGIWAYERKQDSNFSWEEAIKFFQQSRDSSETVAIRIYMDEKEEPTFKPEYVIQYLK